jgi:hypothetical protein
MHRLVADSASVAFAGFETDRERFLGRNGSMRRPRGLEEGSSGSQGAMLDPIMAVCAEVNLAPYATEHLAFVTIAGPSRQSVDETAARYETLTSFEWLLSDAHAEAGREAARLGLSAARLPELQALLSSLLAPRAELRATSEQRSANALGQRGLWGLGISGDQPLLLVETTSGGQGTDLADLVRAHQLCCHALRRATSTTRGKMCTASSKSRVPPSGWADRQGSTWSALIRSPRSSAYSSKCRRALSSTRRRGRCASSSPPARSHLARCLTWIRPGRLRSSIPLPHWIVPPTFSSTTASGASLRTVAST